MDESCGEISPGSAPRLPPGRPRGIAAGVLSSLHASGSSRRASVLPCALAARNKRERKAAGWKTRVFECRNGNVSTQTAPSAPAGGEGTARAPPAWIFALQPGVLEPFGEPLPPVAQGKVSVELPRCPKNPKRSREMNSTARSAPNPRQGRASACPELISRPREPRRALGSLSRGARIEGTALKSHQWPWQTPSTSRRSSPEPW